MKRDSDSWNVETFSFNWFAVAASVAATLFWAFLLLP